MRRTLTLLVLAILVVGGLWAGRLFAPCSPPMALFAKFGVKPDVACPAPVATAAEAPREVEPPAVTVAAALRRRFVDRLFVSGTVVAREEAQVAARIDGLTIVELDAEDGDHVAQGQVLARLDRSQLEALLAENDAATTRSDAAIDQARSLIDQSKAQVGFASADFERARKLGGQVMSVSSIEQRETAMKTAQAQLDAATNALAVAEADRKSRDAERKELQVRIDRAEVRSPVDGVISRRSAKLGATASAIGEPLFRVVVDGAVDLEADVPEQFIARLAVGMPAEIHAPGIDAAIAGKVRLVSEEIDKASRTGKVRIALAPASAARVGAFASGQVTIATSDGLGVPSTAVQRDADSARLLVVKNNLIEGRKVTLGISEGDEVEIRSGLGEGESVVARSAAFLRPGDRVRPMAMTAALNDKGDAK